MAEGTVDFQGSGSIADEKGVEMPGRCRTVNIARAQWPTKSGPPLLMLLPAVLRFLVDLSQLDSTVS